MNTANATTPKIDLDTSAKEQRLFTRIPFDADVHVCSTRKIWKGKLLNISLKGLLMARPTDWNGKKSDPYLVELSLGKDVSIKMLATLAHSSEAAIGFYCKSIDVESMAHLKRLLEFNLGNQLRFNQELWSSLRSLPH